MLTFAPLCVCVCVLPQVESLEDMRRFMTEHMDFTKLQGNVTKHVNLMSELSEQVSKRNMLEVSEVRHTRSLQQYNILWASCYCVSKIDRSVRCSRSQR